MLQGIEYLKSDEKRNLDIAVSMALIAAALPFAVVLALASTIDTGENPIFTQMRVGRGGDAFKVFKFRTIASKIGSSATFGTFDPRASSLGQAIRQTGLDELPQLVNVALGHMSMVGARPMVERDLEQMQSASPELYEEWYPYKTLTRPAMTGISQLYRHGLADSRSPEACIQTMELDLRYFTTATLAEDCRIMANTPRDMLRANMRVLRSNPVTPPASDTGGIDTIAA